MRAVARVVAHADADGRTRIAVLRSEPPLLLRHTPSHGISRVYLLGGAAGPLGGDDLRLEIEVGAGAALEIRGIAASIALPARSAATSRMRVEAKIGGELRWLAEPLIAASGCRHEALSNVDLDEGARLLWREELICGRHDEPPGDATVAMSLTYARKPLLRQALRIGPDAPGSGGPGVLAGAKAVGCLIGVGLGSIAGNDPESAWMPLAGQGWMITATAGQAARLRPVLTPAWLSAA